jgi:CheY-like chemotaxis protein
MHHDVEHASVARAAGARSQSLCALVVDDDPCVLRVVSRLLAHAGYEVHVAACAEEALERLTSTRAAIRLLVSDIELPGMSGTELACLARRACSGLAVVLMSGATTGYLLQRGMIEQGTRVLEKPFVAADLLDRVGVELEGTARRRTNDPIHWWRVDARRS